MLPLTPFRRLMAEDWSIEEVEATVADYFAMLEHELRGESYNKKEHNRQLQLQLRGRSPQAIEFKHANISLTSSTDAFGRLGAGTWQNVSSTSHARSVTASVTILPHSKRTGVNDSLK